MFPLLLRKLCTASKLSISNIVRSDYVGKQIHIEGWVKSVRKMKENIFVDVSDGSTTSKLQIIVPHVEKYAGLTPGASVKANGILERTEKGQLELRADHVDVVGQCVVTDGYPFAPRKSYTPDYVRQHLQFRPRTNRFASLLRVRSVAQLAIHNYFHERGFFLVNTPILTSNDCEGAGEMFKVVPANPKVLEQMAKRETQSDPDRIYFDTKAYLTVSGQLHLEAAAHGLGNVYTLGPIFRAENSKSRLHLSEFYMLEVEVAFLDDIQSLTDLTEHFVKTLTEKLLHNYENEFAACRDEAVDFHWIEKKFCVITYDEAVSMVQKTGTNVNKKDGLTKEDEYAIIRHCGNVPTFVIDWPKDIKPFYMRECEADNSKVAAFDLLVPHVGELVGGSLRENDYDKLNQRVCGSSTDDLKWYLDIRKFGGVPTGGFGLGLERYLQFILGISNIKDTIPFPRWAHNCKL